MFDSAPLKKAFEPTIHSIFVVSFNYEHARLHHHVVSKGYEVIPEKGVPHWAIIKGIINDVFFGFGSMPLAV